MPYSHLVLDLPACGIAGVMHVSTLATIVATQINDGHDIDDFKLAANHQWYFVNLSQNSLLSCSNTCVQLYRIHVTYKPAYAQNPQKVITLSQNKLALIVEDDTLVSTKACMCCC